MRASGRGGIGIELGATWRDIEEQQSWILGGAVVFRYPLAYGVILAGP